MQIITDVYSNENKLLIERMISKYSCAAEHNYHCYIDKILDIGSNGMPYVCIFEDDMGILATYDSKTYEYRVFTEILAPSDKKAELLRKFLDHLYSFEDITKRPKKVVLELESDTRKNVLDIFKDTDYKCNPINYNLIWPVFELDKWNGDLMQGGEWKDIRYYWNKFFRDHKVEFSTADKINPEELKKLVYDWKKNRTTGDRAYVDYYIRAIDSKFVGYDVTRIMIVDGKVAAITAGFNSRPGYYYDSIGLYDTTIPRCNEIANMDDLINLKKLGFKIIDFGGVEKHCLDFKNKFRPTRYYKTHVFSIVKNAL
ncbi:MAG: hypothetical protein ACP5N1_00150 [Candidatus Woesearchaeota archaeon]